MQAVILLSGGMDSATLLYRVVHHYGRQNVAALSVNYGQRHVKEMEFAYALAHGVGVSHQVAHLDSLQHLLKSALTTAAVPVPDGHYTDESMKATVVPMRNAIFLSVAIGYAWSQGAEEVHTAVHAGDHVIYPDCRPEFIEAFNRMARAASDGFIQPFVVAPFVNMTKRMIADIGNEYMVPWAATWSCYKNGQKHCGTCGTCTERREALAHLGDPTVYLA